MTHYPGAELVMWEYRDAAGNPTYFKGMNRPEAVVLHISQGHASTARAWAAQGHYGASWHYFVCLDGKVLQQLEHEDGGYHAGIASPPAPTPTWALWRGSTQNINTYTIGIEQEGFSGDGFPEAQRLASRDLCRWLASELGFPYDRDHFPPHADIDLVNRPNDFGPPEYREEHYRFMFEEESLTPEDVAAISAGQFLELLAQAIGAKESTFSDTVMVDLIRSRLTGVSSTNRKIDDHIANHAAGLYSAAIKPGTEGKVIFQ